jgi:hypothetical protein
MRRCPISPVLSIQNRGGSLFVSAVAVTSATFSDCFATPLLMHSLQLDTPVSFFHSFFLKQDLSFDLVQDAHKRLFETQSLHFPSTSALPAAFHFFFEKRSRVFWILQFEQVRLMIPFFVANSLNFFVAFFFS